MTSYYMTESDADRLHFDLEYTLRPLAERYDEAAAAREDLVRQADRIDDRLAAVDHELSSLQGTVTAYKTAMTLLEAGERPGLIRRELARMLQHRPSE